MHIQVVNKGIDASEALSERVRERLTEAVEKYAHRPGEAIVVIEREGYGFRVDCSVHLPTGVMLQSRAGGEDAYGAAESALDRLEKRLRRYKRRLVSRRGPRNSDHGEPTEAAHVVLQGRALGDDDEVDESAPGGDLVVVAETSAELPMLTVGMAVLELELADAPVLVFRNAAHGSLNVVFRRPDGHIGWIDPARGQPQGAAPS
jgi:ribosomal subunit interface protein